MKKSITLLVLVLASMMLGLSCKKGIHITNKDLKYKWSMDVIYQDSLGVRYWATMKVRSTVNQTIEEIMADQVSDMMDWHKYRWMAVVKIEKEK